MKKTFLSSVAFVCLAVLSSQAVAGDKTYSTEPNYYSYKKPAQAPVQDSAIDKDYYIAVRGLVGWTTHNIHAKDENGNWERAKKGDRKYDDFVTTGGEAALGTYVTDSFRMELAYTYKENTSGNHDSYHEIDDGDSYHAKIDQDLEQHLAMLNLYYDFDLGCVKPYVMAGVGYSKTKYTIKFKQTINGVLDDDFKSKFNHSHIAWAVGAGLGIDLTDQITFEIGYRYTDAGQIKGYPEVNGSTDEQDMLRYKTHTHEALAGIRYSF